jgi:quinol monooxygenase YgiN
MATTYVSAVIRAKDGREAELERELAGVVADVRAEPGCLRYDLHRSGYGNVFFFYEIWESAAHLAAHAKTPHMEAMHRATADLTDGPSEVNTWEAVEVGK